LLTLIQLKVVEDTSSTFGDANIEIAQHIANNHMDMCRFKGFDDGEYEKVAAALCRIFKAIEENVQHSGQSESPLCAY
jgi:hypothetical protein